MGISYINKILGSNYPTLESFELNATWEKDIKGKSITASFASNFPHKIDWDYFSRRYNLSEESIRINHERVNWEIVSCYRTLSESFILEFKDKVSWWSISKYQKLSENFIREFQDIVNWKYITTSQKLSVKFIEENVQKGLIDLKLALKHQELSNEFIEKNINNLDLVSVIIYQDVTIEFIEKFKKTINWSHVSKWIDKSILDENRKIELVEKYINYLDWDYISTYWQLSVKIVSKFQNKFIWNEINKRASFSEEFIREFQDKLDWINISQNCNISEEFIEEFKDKVDWSFIGENYELSLAFIRKHKDKLKRAKITTNDLSTIRELIDCISFKEIKYLDFDEELLYEFKEKVCWEILIKYRKLSETLIDKVSDLFEESEWRWLCDKQPLSETFIRKHYKEVHWGGICQHQILSESFIDEIYSLTTKKVGNNNILLNDNGTVWWNYIIKYQKLSANYSRKIQNYRFSMIPYQKNEFIDEVIESLSEEEKVKHLCDSWLYKSSDFRKEQIENLNLFECFENHFIAYIIVDSNRFQPMYFHYKFVKKTTIETFATQTEDEFSNRGYKRAKGLYVGTYENLNKYYNLENSSKQYKELKVRVLYEDVVRIVYSDTIMGKKDPVIRCKKLYVLV